MKKVLCTLLIAIVMSLGITSQALANAIGVVNFGVVEKEHKEFKTALSTYEQTVKRYREDFDAKYAKSSDLVKAKAIKDYNFTLEKDKMRIFSKINTDIKRAVHAVVVRRALAGAVFTGYVVEGETVDITKDVLSRVKRM